MPKGYRKDGTKLGFQEGEKHSEEHNKRISVSMTGKHLSQEAKRKIKEKATGRKTSIETRQKMAESQKRIGHKPPLALGNKHPNWKGGIGKEPYPFDFNKELKLLIKKRDNYICQFPDCGIRENGKAHCVHHTDYDKKNLDPMNLITLCNKHNLKVNFNREYWKGYFQNKITEGANNDRTNERQR